MIGVEPGTLFAGRYQIIRSIGAGGMGAVYLASDTRYPDFVIALKVLYPGVIKTPEARTRFRNEIVASYRVSHPNIIRAYEYFDEEDFQAYAMEYVSGGDLHEKIRTGPCGVSEVVSILKQIASGLEAVHTNGIVHRDLKPENILITNEGVVKITDFGVARLKGSSTLTQAGAMVGTPKYLSPEYVETGSCDHRGDLYAVGVIGYELISRKSPFRSDSKVSLIVERLKQEVPPLTEIARHCPLALARIIEKAMSVKVTARYQSAQELREDLERFERGEMDAIKESDWERPAAADTLVERKALIKQVTEKIKLAKSSLLLIGVAAICVLLGAVLFKVRIGTKTEDQLSAMMLPLGNYSGMVTGLLSDNTRYPFRLWRTSAGVFILLGKAHCNVSMMNSKNQFNCGDLVFEIAIDSIEKANAVGTIKELGWNTVGTFTLGGTGGA